MKMPKKEMIQMKLFQVHMEAQNIVKALASKAYIETLVICMMLITCVVPVYADTGSLLTDFTSQLQNIYSDLLPVVHVVALILGSAAGLVYMLSSDEKNAAAGKKWGTRIVIGWLIITILPYLLVKGRELFGSSVDSVGVDQLKTIKPGKH
jgi:nitrogen fixation/metabolism regulation signal transduction histidine kinase